jgi:hypothetical protein
MRRLGETYGVRETYEPMGTYGVRLAFLLFTSFM